MIAIVGSRSLQPTSEIVTAIASTMLAADALEPYGVRVNAAMGVSSSVEMIVVRLCLKLGLTVIAFEPLGGGRASVFERDYRLVDAATRVIAFFPLDGFMAGGTGHIVKAALDRGVEVEAYAITDSGDAVLMGSSIVEGLHDHGYSPDPG